MKIAILNNLYKPYQKGGAERIVEILKSDFEELGHQTVIITTKPDNKPNHLENPGVYYLRSNYRNLENYSLFFRLFWQIGNLFNLRKYFEVKRILKLEKPDIIITNNLMGLGVLTFLVSGKSKHLHIIHDIQLLHPSGLMYFGKEKIINSLYAKCYQRITKVVTNLNKKTVIISPSRWLLQTHQNQGLFLKHKTVVINNPFKPLGQNIATRNRDIFLFIGQLEKHKGIDLFIEAANHFKNYQFVAIGSGQLKEQIEDTENLVFVGQKTAAEINDFLSRSLALIVPSRCYENSPTVIYEAAALGIPVIAANLGGIPELINRFGGLTFHPDDINSLVEAISQSLSEKINPKPFQTEDSYGKRIISQLKISV